MSLKLSPYQDSINDLRVIVLVEKSSFSNKYLQIAFTKEQYIKLLDFLESTGTKDDDGFDINVMDDVEVVLPDLQETVVDNVSVQDIL
jgi:hypothetical protein